MRHAKGARKLPNKIAVTPNANFKKIGSKNMNVVEKSNKNDDDENNDKQSNPKSSALTKLSSLKHIIQKFNDLMKDDL
jgi:hypothetical protein